MIRERLAALGAMLAGLLLFAAPALANHVDTGVVNVTCTEYTIQLSASDLVKGNDYTIKWSISGLGAKISDSVSFTAASSKYKSGDITRSIGPLSGTLTPSGTATLEGFNTIALTFSPETVNCSGKKPKCVGANSTLINHLGSAGPQNFAVLSMGGSGAVVNLNLATVFGNVGLPNYGTLKESAPSAIIGEVIAGSGTNTSGLKGKHGTIVINDTLLTKAVQDANAAAAFAAGLSSTASVQDQFPADGKISGDITVTGKSGLNVVHLPQFLLKNGRLTLTGPAGAAFIIDISGNFNMHTGTIEVAGGVGPLDVLFNITNPQASVTTMVPTTGVGILLAPNNAINTMDSSAFVGEMIGGYGKTITLMSGTHFKNPCTCGSTGGGGGGGGGPGPG